MIEELINVLEHSIKKNGDKPLTLSHLLNILKKVERDADKSDFYGDLEGARHECY
jgi:hypothetical protein